MSIELVNLNKNYKKPSGTIHALSDINLKIENSEMIAITGPSGSGKSTLLNILGLIDTQTSGDYFFNKENTKNFKDKKLSELRNRCFGFIIQDYCLIEDYTVYENVEIPLNYFSSNINKNERVKEILKDLKILEKIKVQGKNLSGGQRQRVSIARAIVNNPSIVLADEPTAALDRNTGQSVLNILKNINKNGKTVIIVTHNEEVASFCDRIIRLEDGKLIESYGKVL